MKTYKIQDKDVLVLRISSGTTLYKYVESNSIEQTTCEIFNRLTGSDFYDDDYYEDVNIDKLL